MKCEELFYDMIFKRKSFHLFRNIGEGRISKEELQDIEETYKKLTPLFLEIRTAIRIVPTKETTCKRGQEYCVLLYSEKKENYLQNIGYLGEQLDLYLVSREIGTLWFGIGKVEEPSCDGLDFVIMIAIAKVDDAKKFRKDMFKSKRKQLEEIWNGEFLTGVSDIVRYAPSACNTQPWFVENKEDELLIYRYKKRGKRGIMPAAQVSYYNRIDVGIFLCFMELCLNHEGIAYERTLYVDLGENAEKTLTAKYKIREKSQ